MKVQNEETCKSLASKDVGLQRAEKQLEEKTLECGVLSRQLQNALDDAQRQVDARAFTRRSTVSRFTDASVLLLQVETNMQKVLAKERTSQSRALDLQSQLSRAKAEQSQLQRSKEEVEREEVGGQRSVSGRSAVSSNLFSCRWSAATTLSCRT